MKRVFAADIKPGDQVADIFRVVEARLAPYRDESKGQYMHLVLADRSGQVEARLWEGAGDLARWLAPGDVVRIQARATLYQGRIRLRLQSLEPADEEVVEPGDLLPAPRAETAEALAAIHGAIGRMASQPLKDLLSGIFGDPDVVGAFCLAPPERPGDLLGRTVDLIELAAPLARLDPALDADLLLAAILLHEIGYTKAVDSTLGNKSVAWLGVPILSDQVVAERLAHAPDFPPYLALALRNAILAAGGVATARSKEAAALVKLKELQATLAR